MRSVRRFGTAERALTAGWAVVELDGVGRTDEPLAMQIALTVSRRSRLKLDSC